MLLYEIARSAAEMATKVNGPLADKLCEVGLFKIKVKELCGRPPQYAPAPCKLTFDLLTLKVVSESRVTWASTSVLILVFVGLSVLDLGPMYATDRQTDVRQTSDRRQTRIIA